MGKTILLVEDQPEIRDVMQMLLRLLGYDVTVAAHGVQGLQYISQHSFDLVITDILMPVMDGNEFIKELSKIANPPPVIALAGSTSEIEPNTIVKEVACKPLTIQQIKQMLARVLPR
ncbi:MAG: response regulator receiver protein [Chloroflexi bacterium]|nr:response regulator receiver protein [Chloroflexota bacterium]